MAERGMDCATCGRQTLHRRVNSNDVLWALLTCLSCGLFVIPWLLDVNSSLQAPWLCPFCGTPRPTLVASHDPAPSGDTDGPAALSRLPSPSVMLTAGIGLVIVLTALAFAAIVLFAYWSSRRPAL